MLKWFHKLFNPHCPHCIEELKDNSVNETIELLKHELNIIRAERDKLLDRLLNPVVEEIKVQQQEDIQSINKFTRHIPWTLRKQLLENEDRHRASLLKEQQLKKPKDDIQEIEELEKELDIATAKRENSRSS